MKVAYCSLLLPEEKRLAERSKKRLSGISLHKFTSALINGIDANLDEPLTIFNIINTLNYPNFPDIIFKTEQWHHNKGCSDWHIGYVNLFGIKYITQEIQLYKKLREWVLVNINHDCIICVHHIYYPAMKAAFAIKKEFSNVKICLITGDMNGSYGLQSQYKKNIKYLLTKQLERKIDFLATQFDCFVFATKDMAEAFKVKSKPFVVVECAYLPSLHIDNSLKRNESDDKIIFYAGAIRNEYGIPHLLRAFSMINKKNYYLQLAGDGNAVPIVKDYAQKNTNIQFLGFIPPQEVEKRQQLATITVSPRTSDFNFVKYSFPSKSLDCLASGIPYIAHRLPCDPPEYGDFIQYADDETDEALKNKIVEICELSLKEREVIGIRAKQFILEQKNPVIMAKKLSIYGKLYFRNSSILMKLQIKTYKILENYFTVLIYVIFMSGNTVLFSTNGNKLFIFFSLVCECLLGCLLFIYIVYKVDLKFPTRFMFCFLLLVGNVLFTWLYNWDFSSFGYVYYILVFSGGYLITEWMNYRNFFIVYDKVVYFLSIVSLFFTILYYIAPTIITYFPITYNEHNIGFYNLFLWVTPTDFEYEFRNYGCFREPGVFQVYIMLALMFHFSKHKINIKKIIVYSITLITTKSTTGYILYVLLLGSYFFKKQISLVKRVLLFIVFLSAVGGVVVYELSKSGYSVFQKFALTNISFMTRLSNIVVNYHIFLKSPLFGVGITSQMDLHHLLPQQLFNINTEGVDTNTFFSLFATFGVVYGMLSLIGTYKMVTLIAKSKIDKLLYFLIMFLALITENFRYSIFFYVLFWYGINAHKINEYPCFISKR